MKKNLFGLTIILLFLSACSSDDTLKETTDATSSVAESEPSKQKLYTNIPRYILEDNTFALSGKNAEGSEVTLSVEGEIIDTLEVDGTEKFEFVAELPSDIDTNYEVSDGDRTQIVLVKSKTTLEKTDAEIEAERKEEERKKAEEEQKKAEEEARIKEQEAAKAAKEAEAKAEADAKRKAQEDAEREKQNLIDNASREQKNALQKAKDYLSFTSFSKSGLYNQLIYEKYPDDAAQFAIDNIEVDWNAQALNKAEDYLSFTAFSDQGLYDQLIYEGFSQEEAQYAIDNLAE